MLKVGFLLASMALFLLSFTATGLHDKPFSNSVFLVIGDSISNGHRLATPWPDRLSDAMSVQLINHSVSGELTSWGVSQIDAQLRSHQPSHVFIMMGTNDVARGESNDVVDTALNNIKTMVRKAKKAGARVYVSTILPIPATQYQHIDSKGLELSRRILALTGVTVVDVRAAFKDAKGLLADDVHPNQTGQDLIAQCFLAKLMEINKANGL